MFIAATRKLDRALELVNLHHIVRVWVNRDTDPETLVRYVSGETIAYVEHPQHFVPEHLWRGKWKNG